jgi:L-serine dehydratase
MLQTLSQTRANCPTEGRPVDSVGFSYLYKIGIGPSSSHTVGFMKAAASFRNTLLTLPDHIERVLVTVSDSLAWTGRGHATDKALILGLAGHSPEFLSPENVDHLVAAIESSDGLPLLGGWKTSFVRDPYVDLYNSAEELLERGRQSARSAPGLTRSSN